MGDIPKGISFFENNPETQVWTHPDDIFVSNFDFGETYLNIISQKADPKQSNDIAFEAFPLGRSNAIPIGVWVETIPISGWAQDLQQRNQIVKFFGKHRVIGKHPVIYLIIRDVDDDLGNAQYWEFVDPTDNTKPYAPGWISDQTQPYSAEDRKYNYKGTFQVVWA
jgi:hypothetical protein